VSPLGIKVFLPEGFNRGESTIVLHHTNLFDCDKGFVSNILKTEVTKLFSETLVVVEVWACNRCIRSAIFSRQR